MDFMGKICVVTGAANGIGRCIAESFLQAGAHVAIIDKDEEAGKRLEVQFSKERVLFFCGDVSQKSALEEFAKLTIDRFKKVDCLVNNAGINRGGLLSNCSYEAFEYAQRVGVTAVYYLTGLLKESFAPGACVVNIASSRAFQSQPDTESYVASKGGIISLTHAMSASLAGRARVNVISPGWIDTTRYHDGKEPLVSSLADHLQQPVGRIGRPEDIANMALFLCSEKAGFITGQNVVVDGGMTKNMIYHGDFGWSYTPPKGDAL